ncbi:MAG TPA: hypothetical protein VHG91_00375 [Longimicrobium sp.]|nr:hypothetical protein [Longimicrobium sp.]
MHDHRRSLAIFLFLFAAAGSPHMRRLLVGSIEPVPIPNGRARIFVGAPR